MVREYFFGVEVLCFQIGLFVICWRNMEVLEDFSPIIDHSNLVIRAHSTPGGAN